MSRKNIILMLMAFLMVGCLVKLPLVSITAAENMRKTSDGRIFVTGRQALFELKKNESEQFSAVPVYSNPECQYFAGLSELNDWLFFVCVNRSGLNVKTGKYANAGKLFAYSLINGSVEPILDFHNYQFPNGLDALPNESAILIADEAFYGQGGINKATFDFSTDKPVLRQYQEEWVGRAQNVKSVNGIRVIGKDIYVTDLTSVKRISLDESGNPGKAHRMYKAATVLDDLDATCEGLVVADFVRGKLIYVPFDESTPKESESGLSSPSSVLVDATPMLDAESFLVTESIGVNKKAGNDLVKLNFSQLGINGCKNSSKL